MMQTTTLPIQISGAAAPAARPNVTANQNPGQSFSQTFSQATQRQAAPAPAAPAPAPASKAPAQQGAKANSAPADKAGPARPGGEAGKPAHASSAKADKADKPGADSAKAAAADRDAAAAAEAAANAPVVDMLALVASLNPAANAPAAAPVQQAALPVDDAAPALTGAGAGASDAQTLAALTAQLAPGDQDAPAEQEFTGQPQGQGKGRQAAQPDMAANDRGAAQATNLPALDTDEQQAGAAQARFTLPDIQPAAQPQAAPAVAATQQTSMAQAVANAAGDKLSARVGTQDWDNQVGQKIVWMVAGKEQSASLTLNPPDLGPMQVVLNVTNDHADVTFSAAQPEVRQALEEALPRLREMMSESGLSLGNASVNAGMPEQRQAQAEMNGGGKRGGGTDTGQAGGDAAAGDSGSAAALEQRAIERSARSGVARSLVDTFI